MFQLLESLLEFLDSKGGVPTEQDLTNVRAYKDLVSTWPKLEKQLKLAWNGDAREMSRDGHKTAEGENVYIFPKLLKVSSLEKYDPDFKLTMPAKRCIAELFTLFCDKFKIANRRNTNWMER
jgi:hypothetical protein